MEKGAQVNRDLLFLRIYRRIEPDKTRFKKVQKSTLFPYEKTGIMSDPNDFYIPNTAEFKATVQALVEDIKEDKEIQNILDNRPIFFQKKPACLYQQSKGGRNAKRNIRYNVLYLCGGCRNDRGFRKSCCYGQTGGTHFRRKVPARDIYFGTGYQGLYKEPHE